MITIEQSKEKANQLIVKYPNAKTVEDLMDIAVSNKEFKNDSEMLAIWGRVARLLPFKVGK